MPKRQQASVKPRMRIPDDGRQRGARIKCLALRLQKLEQPAQLREKDFPLRFKQGGEDFFPSGSA